MAGPAHRGAGQILPRFVLAVRTCCWRCWRRLGARQAFSSRRLSGPTWRIVRMWHASDRRFVDSVSDFYFKIDFQNTLLVQACMRSAASDFSPSTRAEPSCAARSCSTIRRRARRDRRKKKYLAAPNVIGVIVGGRLFLHCERSEASLTISAVTGATFISPSRARTSAVSPG
jgi:hypothetical protein